MTRRNENDPRELISQINERLDSIETLMSFSISAMQRFRVGQRVKFSPAAKRAGVSTRTKRGVQKGRVVGMDGFTVRVLLDGYKKPHAYHHIFFV